jgi:hypothetical protein
MKKTITTNLFALTSILALGALSLPACGDDDDSSTPSGDGDGDGDADAGDGDGDGDGDAGPDAGEICEPVTASCEADAGTDGGALGIIGSYTDDFDGEWSVGQCEINGEPVLAYSNEEGWVVVQNSCDATFNPGKFSRYDFSWVETDAGLTLYVCTQVFAADSVQDAVDAPAAGNDDPATGGCGAPDNDFPWSTFTPAE